ncbi:MAG TPA: tyrosine-type recombinase/integrase [Acidimicrobiales bacterium]|nr:tyrosine-type recombinase/integrase [Acidimicrobiales bacterium]
MELYFVSRAALAALSEPVRGRMDVDRLCAVLDRAAVPDRMPFLIADHGLSVTRVNDFFRDLPASGCRSPETWRAYALDVFRFFRYLESMEQVDVFAATNEHVERYRWIRLNGSQPVRPSTWNREVAALERFYSWAVRRGHAAEMPFRYGDAVRSQHSQRGGRRNLARARVADTAPVRFLTVEQYLFFRDVGLYGLAPDGRRDPSFNGEQPFRNKLFADLLVTTGLRVREAAALTRVEVPSPSSRATRLAIAGPTAKRSKPRDVLVPAAVVDRLRFYVRGARAEVVERNGIRTPSQGEIAVSVDGANVRTAGSRVDLSLVEPEKRWRMVEVRPHGLDPLALFVGRGAKPVRPQAWDRVFAAASARCSGFGSADLPKVRRVTPHMLRHTFAVHTLSALLTEQVRRGKMRDEPGTTALRHVAENPLRRLQKLLGHSHVATTYTYLDSLDETNELVDAALERWDTEATWADLVGGRS